MALWNESSRMTMFVSSTELQVTLTATDLAVGGTAQLVIVNPDGSVSASMTFTINNPAPQLTGISPSVVSIVSAGSIVTVTGSGFVPTSSVTWNGASHLTTYVSATELQVTVAAVDVATVGTANIGVSNPAPAGGASTSEALSIVYPVPVITSLTPSSVPAGVTTTFMLIVNGTGFGPTSVVQLDGTNFTTRYVNASQLTVPLDLEATAPVRITVMTPAPGGGTSAPVMLGLSAGAIPELVSVNPSAIPVNSPNTAVELQGFELTAATTVQINGGSPINVNAGSSSFVVFTVPAADLTSLGTLSITASNPGSAASNALQINVTTTPVPTLSELSPARGAIGGGSFTVTVLGSGFVPASVVQLNGTPLATTFVSLTELTATVTSADLLTLGNSSVTVFSPPPGGGTSSALVFTTCLPVPANDLAYSATTGLLYASVPSAGGPALGNSVVPIDPNTGTIGTPIYVGSEPGKMALSSDGTVIWVGLNGSGAVREVNLISQTAGLQFGLGGGTGLYNPPSTAQALAVMPGLPNTVAVAVGNAANYSSLVTIYDSGVARANAMNGAVQCCSGVTGLAFDPTGTKLFEAGIGYGIAMVNSTGITSATSLNAGVTSTGLWVDNQPTNERAYLSSGVVLDANLGTQLGVFSVGANQNASGPVAPDVAGGQAFVLIDPSDPQVNAYNLSTFVLNGSITAAPPSSTLPLPNPMALVRWGQDGVAFSDGGQLYIFQSPLVNNLTTSLADLGVTASAPASAATGAPITYTLTVSNAGPVAATPATLTDVLPSGSVFQSVTPSQGSCTGGAVVFCDLGNLNSGASVTVQVTATALTPGMLASTASVTSPEGDPNLNNNTATSMTTVTGAAYSLAPQMTSISPAFVQAGANTFTLTVNGSGFVAGSAVQWNSTPLSTNFVSSTELTASVAASNVASMGWAWINVANPAPGGGISMSLPLTFYGVVSLDVNHFGFDPFTRKLYATVPSTAPQITGNSIVAIDPSTGSLGTPVSVGSGPDQIAESSDGQYLFIGLDGAESLTSLNLTSGQQGPVFPLTVSEFGTATQIAPRGLAVAPSDDNLVAIDTGADAGIGLFDISGNTGTMRPNLTGTYTGSNIVFGNSSTVYSYDTDTSGAEFYRWNVTATGLELNNNTGYTLDGFGGFSGGFRLASGLAYGFGGGVADPAPTPPVQLGQFEVSSAFGSGQTVGGSGVAPDPIDGRVFFLGETEAGTANPVLLSYDSSRYVLLDSQTFTGLPEGEDLVRWGRDGLAWHTSLSGGFGGGTGSGKIILLQGPAVLPSWNTVNPTPALGSATPASATVGGGNIVLAITGSGFVPGVVVTWNGAQRSTTLVDSGDLTVDIPASDLVQSGTASLAANNPGSANSNLISFTIN